MGQQCSQKCCRKDREEESALCPRDAVPVLSDERVPRRCEEECDDGAASSSYFEAEAKELAQIRRHGGCQDGIPYEFESGAIYTGFWKNNARHGLGRQSWVDGAVYEGEWRDNAAFGKGRFIHPDGDVFIGVGE